MVKRILVEPIGHIKNEHKVPEKTPIQPVFAKDCKGKLEVFPQYEKGLKDLDGFSHVILIYLFHKAGQVKLTVKPFLEDKERGLFATRAPCRPNPLGISIVDLLKIEANILFLDHMDILDGTPVLDIKPYVGRFDIMKDIRVGWQTEIDDKTALRLGRRGYSGGGKI